MSPINILLCSFYMEHNITTNNLSKLVKGREKGLFRLVGIYFQNTFFDNFSISLRLQAKITEAKRLFCANTTKIIVLKQL